MEQITRNSQVVAVKGQYSRDKGQKLSRRVTNKWARSNSENAETLWGNGLRTTAKTVVLGQEATATKVQRTAAKKQ